MERENQNYKEKSLVEGGTDIPMKRELTDDDCPEVPLKRTAESDGIDTSMSRALRITETQNRKVKPLTDEDYGIDVLMKSKLTDDGCPEVPMKLALTTEGGGVDFSMNRVLSSTEILKHIFSFLPLESIKTCRFVCHEWNEIAEQLMLKLARITFSNNRFDPEDARLPDKFIDDFQNSSLQNKFDKFCFNSPESSIEYEDLVDFIAQFGSDMKELTIFRINIRCAMYKLRHRELINLIPSYLTKLDVVCEDVNTQLIIPMDRLKNIKTLRLGESILKIVKDVAVAPVELQLKNIYFLENRKNYQRIVKLNDLFNFRNLQILRLDCSDTENIELDMGGVANLKLLILDRIKIVNWESSKWTVNKLTLGKKMKFDVSTGMTFKELDYGGPVIDFAVLPSTLKDLTMRKLKTKMLNIESARNLVNLQYLTLHRLDFSLLTNFTDCSKLTHLHLIPSDSDDGDLTVINVNTIPKSVKVFRLSYDCELNGTSDFQLETLITDNIEFEEAFYIAEQFKPKNVFFYCFDFEQAKTDSETNEPWEELMLRMFEKFIVGPILPPEKGKFLFSFEENPKADYLMKNPDDAVATKNEIRKIEIDRIKQAWWTDKLL